jgi:hypothetical protein
MSETVKDCGIDFKQFVYSRAKTIAQTRDLPNIVVRQVVGLKLQKGCCVAQVQRLQGKIDNCPVDSVGQFQREIYQREIAVYREKFTREYDEKYYNQVTMGKFLSNWYGHRIVNFVPCQCVDFNTDIHAVIYYG